MCGTRTVMETGGTAVVAKTWPATVDGVSVSEAASVQARRKRDRRILVADCSCIHLLHTHITYLFIYTWCYIFIFILYTYIFIYRHGETGQGDVGRVKLIYIYTLYQLYKHTEATLVNCAVKESREIGRFNECHRTQFVYPLYISLSI